MSSDLRSYEYVALAAPGAVIILAAMAVYPSSKEVVGATGGFNLGELGLFLIVAFIAGHIVQAIGNLLEKVVWQISGGWPSTWLLNDNHMLLSPPQRQRVFDKIKTNYGIDPATLKPREFFLITRELYTAISKENRQDRIEAFNRQYGLLRGLATSFFLCVPLTFVANGQSSWEWMLTAFVVGAICLVRMIRFGIYYSRELFLEFLRL